MHLDLLARAHHPEPAGVGDVVGGVAAARGVLPAVAPDDHAVRAPLLVPPLVVAAEAEPVGAGLVILQVVLVQVIRIISLVQGSVLVRSGSPRFLTLSEFDRNESSVLRVAFKHKIKVFFLRFLARVPGIFSPGVHAAADGRAVKLVAAEDL